jgi:hypothetical protein
MTKVERDLIELLLAEYRRTGIINEHIKTKLKTYSKELEEKEPDCEEVFLRKIAGPQDWGNGNLKQESSDYRVMKALFCASLMSNRLWTTSKQSMERCPRICTPPKR